MDLWQRYWVLGVGALIKNAVSKCVVCRRYNAKASQQKMASLPTERVMSDKPVFDNSGLDMFGPFEIKQGRSMVKRYGLLFTCLATRAIHLEIVQTANTDSCLNAIRRFICRRGIISSLRTDNGTNFIGAEKELRVAVNAWNDSEIPEWLKQMGIRWEFNPPAASHFGGVWERLIRTVRKVINGVLQEQCLKLDDEGIRTLFCEVESIINSRPISTISSDPNDLQPLTPSMLLTLKEKASMPPGIFDRNDAYSRRRWRQVQYLANLFWARWRKEYLPMLQKRQKWCDPKRNLTCGDIVLVMDESLPRNSWLLGRIVEVNVDSSGFVRSCSVKTQHSVLKRPISKLCLLLEMDQDRK
ncbi:uncharacterized protein LOC117119905 [Anneissia japonica]|uniref:uncharacterized protein LOC117119905 n=1 Tax=Anneissia japonica TaxID=1529436 RepID=UPI001425B9ED|nr:uncharacterized protein LOC117119905 [Anneissia japonica]